jgi:hypothetical protein
MRSLHRTHDDATVHVGIPIYVHDPSRERTVRIEITSTATAWWATVRALISLNDPRDPDRFRLQRDGIILKPHKSLADSEVPPRVTLELIDTRAEHPPPAVPPRRSRSTLRPA